MYLSAFLHRNELFEITNRWLSNKLEPGDPLQITKIIAYDSFAAWETLLQFADNFIQTLADTSVHRNAIFNKKGLKDTICNVADQNIHGKESLITQYMEMPEFYYIGSPIVGFTYHKSDRQILSMCRFKRIKRIAEKASRYASLYISDKVQSEVKEIIEKKKQGSFSSKQIPEDIFIEAEKIVMTIIKKNGIQLPIQTMKIKDVLGIKIIDTLCSENELESSIAKCNSADIISKKVHSGNYNAVHYVVELKVDYKHLINNFKNRNMDFSRRGLPVDNLKDDFSKFVMTGSETVHLDLIYTSFEELIESEIGCSMHENRIFKQRHQNKIYGNIPMNIEFIIEYLIAVGLSPSTQIDEIPIKIWGRYLPDTLSHLVRGIYQMPDYSMI
jgi:hypothetical protein